VNWYKILSSTLIHIDDFLSMDVPASEKFFYKVQCAADVAARHIVYCLIEIAVSYE